MQLYNLFYKSGNKVIEKRNITKDEIREFINSLEDVYQSNLQVIKVETRDDEER